MRKRQILRDQRGFTLTEIAIAIAIAGVVAMLAVPSMRGMIPRMQISNDATTLANQIALARAGAISKNNEFRIIFDTANDKYVLRNETDSVNFAGNDMSPYVELDAVELNDPANTATGIAMRPVGTIGFVNASDSYEDFPLGTRAEIFLKTTDGRSFKCIGIESSGRVFIGATSGSVCVES